MSGAHFLSSKGHVSKIESRLDVDGFDSSLLYGESPLFGEWREALRFWPSSGLCGEPVFANKFAREFTGICDELYS